LLWADGTSLCKPLHSSTNMGPIPNWAEASAVKVRAPPSHMALCPCHIFSPCLSGFPVHFDLFTSFVSDQHSTSGLLLPQASSLRSISALPWPPAPGRAAFISQQSLISLPHNGTRTCAATQLVNSNPFLLQVCFFHIFNAEHKTTLLLQSIKQKNIEGGTF
jgi:hypothetical protein